MIKYYFIQFLRNTKRDKTSFFINIIGLTSAFVCVLLIYLWVNDELKIDKFHKNDKQLYIVMSNFKYTQGIETFKYTPPVMADALVSDFPEVESAVVINDFFHNSSRTGILSTDKNHLSAKGFYASKNLFNVLSFDLPFGDKDKVLSSINNIVLSENMARKLFGSPENSIGKSLNWNHNVFKGVFTVSGIFRIPKNCSIEPFDIIFNIDLLLENESWTTEWNGCVAQTFLIIKKGTNIAQFNEKIAKYLTLKVPFYLDKNTIFIQQYSNQYLHGQYSNGIPAGGRIVYVRIFILIAVFILVIAGINYTNLTSAKATLRLKEVGIKKSIGAARKTIIGQYLSESIIISALSILVAIVLVILILPKFNILTGKNLYLLNNPNIIIWLILLTLINSLLAGSYPAFYISGFKPAIVLKGKINITTNKLWIRKALVVFQFTLSVVFILAFLILNKQIKFTQNKNLGYNKDNIICFQWKGRFGFDSRNNNDFDAFVLELKKVPGVVNVTSMNGNILDDIYIQSGISWTEQESEKNFSFQSPIIGYDFIETLEIEIKEGRTFSREHNDDYSKIILNETAAKLMGFENAAGKNIAMNGSSEIIGVVKDFNCGSLHKKIEPLIFRFQPIGQNILVKIQPAAILSTIEGIKKLHKSFYPIYPFEFTFMDDDYQSLYESENKITILSKYFAVLAIIISCLGMFGLAVFNTQKRTKEIGIRKVHGSTSFGIVKLLSLDFSILVVISIIVALPIGYFIMRNWLNGFAYKIRLDWWLFLGTGVITLTISWITVGLQAIKTANINPAISLKDE